MIRLYRWNYQRGDVLQRGDIIEPLFHNKSGAGYLEIIDIIPHKAAARFVEIAPEEASMSLFEALEEDAEEDTAAPVPPPGAKKPLRVRESRNIVLALLHEAVKVRWQQSKPKSKRPDDFACYFVWRRAAEPPNARAIEQDPSTNPKKG